MGSDKAELLYRGQTFLERAKTLLGQAGCSPVLVSGRPDLPEGIPDRQPGQGPARAILDALTGISGQCPGALFIPIDMPLLEADDLRPLIPENPERACAWASHPLPAYFPASVSLPDAAEIRSVKYLLSRYDVEWLEIAASQIRRFGNINSPEDLARLNRPG